MQKLTAAIKDATQDNNDVIRLREASEEWAMFCIRTFKGKLLHEGIAISEAIAGFMEELKDPSDNEDRIKVLEEKMANLEPTGY